MFQDEIMILFEKQMILTNQEIRDILKIQQKQFATLNTEIKRLCDKDMIRRVGVYIQLCGIRNGENVKGGKCYEHR